MTSNSSLTRYAWLSIAAAVSTISLKSVAFLLTGSVGLLSDAMESIVNLVAAVIALWMLSIAERPADEQHAYGHTKAEYFASISEGLLIVLAAISIIITAVNRLLYPKPIEQAFWGLTVSIIASTVNFIVATILRKAGHTHRSITLEADSRHLMTDVLTSVGVIAGVFIVAITNIQFLDPIIALLIGANIIYSGFSLVRRSALGFMDSAIPETDIKVIQRTLNEYCTDGITYHGLRTRQSASRRFVSFHVLVPGNWTVQKGHNLLEKIESAIRNKLEKTTVFTHLEPLGDPRSADDIPIDRL